MNVYFLDILDKPTFWKYYKVCDNNYIEIKKDTGKIKKIIKKLKYSSRKNFIDAVILSKALYSFEELKNQMVLNNINIIDGKWLMKYLILEIVEYISEKRKIKIEECEVAILVNSINDVEIENIKILAKKFKTIKVISNHSERLEKIERKLYEDSGIMLIFSNNKKKSLQKSNFIINFDYVQEEISKYNINNEAIIINLENNIEIIKKRFCGDIINNYNVNCNEDINKSFYARDILESKLYAKTTFEIIRKKIKENDIKISELIGKNGIIM